MKVIVTYHSSSNGEFHEQKLYHVPAETAREIISDFEAFQAGTTEAAAVKTYRYPLVPEQTEARPDEDASVENDESRDGPEGPESKRGIVALDFRNIASIEGFDLLL